MTSIPLNLQANLTTVQARISAACAACGRTSNNPACGCDPESVTLLVSDTTRAQEPWLALTGDLAARINAADSLRRLEDLYLPFKPKRRTKAMIAREAGLDTVSSYIPWLWHEPEPGVAEQRELRGDGVEQARPRDHLDDPGARLLDAGGHLDEPPVGRHRRREIRRVGRPRDRRREPDLELQAAPALRRADVPVVELDGAALARVEADPGAAGDRARPAC